MDAAGSASVDKNVATATPGVDAAAPPDPINVAAPPWAPAVKARAARAEKPALSRTAIVEAALRIIDTEGVESVSMRRVAQEFGTGAASLYAHVANKDELFELVVDAVMGEIITTMRSVGDRSDWRERVKEMTRRGTEVLRSHRDVAKAFLGRIPFGPNGLRAVEAQLAILRSAGVPDRVAAYVGDLLGTYMVAAVIEEGMWKSRFPGATEDDIARQMEEVRKYLESLPPAMFPHLVALSGHMVAGASGGFDRFELGLDIIVRGIDSYVERPADKQR
jgi:AcrR family transcriptional regulator